MSDVVGFLLCVAGFVGLVWIFGEVVVRADKASRAEPEGMSVPRLSPARIALTEHQALEPRSWEAWGHGSECPLCVRERWAAGKSTPRDLLSVTASGTLWVPRP